MLRTYLCFYYITASHSQEISAIRQAFGFFPYYRLAPAACHAWQGSGNLRGMRVPLPLLPLLCLLLSVVPGFGSDVLPGIDVLEKGGFRELQGKRVGLLTNPAGVNRMGVSTIDVLRRAPEVDLVALFGPEHGIYGDEKANAVVQDRTDPRTGLPVFSLYGKTRRPTPEMLARIDVLVVDLQDLGVRSYTYAACMRYAMEECFKAGKEIVVLDRPNPLGGLKVDGPPMEKELMSYVGAFQTPYVHGLTIGELARMAKGTPGWLEVDPKVARHGKLTVIPMQGWQREMLWTDTGLRWMPTSPAIPDLSAAMGYSMTGLGCQMGGFVHGFGTRYPFRLLQYSGKTPEEIEAALRAANIPGLDYRVVHFEENGKAHRGVYLIVKDWQALRPTEISFHLMRIAGQWNAEAGKANPFAEATEAEASLFNKHTGSTALWQVLVRDSAHLNAKAFVDAWQRQALTFQKQSRKFWLYK